MQILLKHLWCHLSLYRRRQLALLLCLMLASAFSEVISLGAIIPFLGVLVSPERVLNQTYFSGLAQTLGIHTPDQAALPFAIAFASAILVANSIRLLLLWLSTRIAFGSGSDLSIEVYRRTLYQPYQVHVARNTSEVLSGITSKVNGVVFGVMQPLLTLISSLVLLVAITLALFVMDPMVALISTIGFGASYGLITFVSRKRLRRNSLRIAQEETQVIKALQEGLGGIRDVLLSGTQFVYCDIYQKADKPLRRAMGNNVFIAGCPRYAMEVLGIALITSLAYVLCLKPDGIASALPILGALALGAQRLLPTLQNIYSAWASIVGSHSSLVDVMELLNQNVPEDMSQPTPETMSFQETIEFKAVSYKYAAENPLVLDCVNLSIPKGARVGFIGRSGSGKSTALDLLMGLLQPTEGDLLIDGKPMNGRLLRSWQMSIAHVPQSIYLSDTTLAENIAFGVPYDSIDMSRVKRAASQAQITEFIESMPNGYSTHVGERGVRLSGGQRQRIAMARALYKQASVLVFDEATSALDSATEKFVMEAIEGLDRELTILIIAHRLTTLQNCDIIVELEHGKIVSMGTYKEMLEKRNLFIN
jgi:ATP-binding cassette subfamily B protein